MKREEVLREMLETIGLVPKFFEGLPDWDLEHEWRIFKGIVVDGGVIPGKYNHLIGLGVSAALRCRYCVPFHTEAARMNGANDDEIKEALLIAKTISGWSTYLNGVQYDWDLFKNELNEIGRFLKAKELKEETLVGAY